MTDAELVGLFASGAGYIDTVSLYPNTNLVLPAGTTVHAGNHSCDPNTWWTDPFSTTARREIAPGEEITLDYATITDDHEFSLACRCGISSCRTTVTGSDWRQRDLQLAYGEHWVPVVRERIAGPTSR